jgi:hypothetical protein
VAVAGILAATLCGAVLVLHVAAALDPAAPDRTGTMVGLAALLVVSAAVARRARRSGAPNHPPGTGGPSGSG